MMEFDPHEVDFSTTDHGFGTYSRTGEFKEGTKWGSTVSGLRAAMEADGRYRFRDTTGGPQSNQLQDIESIEYPEKAMKAVTESKGFAPKRDQPKHHYN